MLKTIGWLLAMVVFATDIRANDLLNAVNALTNYTSPGVYNSQVRGFMTGGGYTVSFPQDRMNFISLTPPEINAGCSGIDVFLGGISYISGPQFTAMLKGIAADSLGEAFNIALRTMCPVCSTVLTDLQKAAQAASTLAMNQCSSAMALLDTGINSVPSLKKYIRGRASLDNGSSGDDGGFFKSFSDYSGKFTDALQKRVQDLQSITDPAQRGIAENRSPLGNSTWKYLAGMQVQQKNFLLSLVGTTIRTPFPFSGKPDALKMVSVAPTLTSKDLANLFMFGASATLNQKLVLTECSGQSTPLTCTNPQQKLVKDSYWYKNEHADISGVSLTDVGFYGLSYALMFQAVDNVAKDAPLGTPADVTLPPTLYGKNVVIHAHFSVNEIKGFMTVASLPLYRAVNIAAFYPDISEQLVSNISEVIAAHYATSYIDHYILNLKKTGDAGLDPGGTQGLSGHGLVPLEKAIKSIRIDVGTNLSALLTQLQTTQVWINTVDQVQATVYQQIIRNGLSQNYAYSLGLTGM